MVYSLRLPPGLDKDARAEADRVGISLNGLVCIALDVYLRGPRTPGVQRDALASLGVEEGVPQLGVMRGGAGYEGWGSKPPSQPVDDVKVRPAAPVPILQTGEQLMARSQAGEKLAKHERVALTAWLRKTGKRPLG